MKQQDLSAKLAEARQQLQAAQQLVADLEKQLAHETGRDLCQATAGDLSVQQYRLLTELISDIVIRTNAAGEFTYVSPSVQQLLGYTPDELLTKPLLGFIHPDDLPYMQETQRQAREVRAQLPPHPDHLPYMQETQRQAREVRAQLPSHTFQVRHKNGHYLWLENNSRLIFDETTGELLEMIGAARDITERKRATDALKESEERFRRAIVDAPFPIMIHADNGTVLHVNSLWTALSGYLEAELPTLSDWSIRAYGPDQGEGQSQHQPLTHGEMQIWTKSGETRIWDFVSSVIGHLPDGSHLYSTMAADLTAHKQADAELEKQRSFLENIINISPSLIFVKDYDGRFVLVNHMVAELYNSTAAAMIGKTDAAFNPNQQEVADFLAADRRVIDTGERLFIEEPVTTNSGETRWLQTTKVPLVSADGKTKYVLGVATDFTERKHAEEALQESEAKYRSLVDTMRGGLLITDKQARITYVNDRICELLGYPPEHFLGQLAFQNLEGANAQKVEGHIKNLRKDESSTYEIVAKHRDGHPVYLLIAGSPLFEKNGAYNGSVAVFTDITAQKQAEEALRQALTKEKELGELKSRFVSMASHEFRTPLAAILTITETLIAYRHKLPDEQIVQRLDRIRVQIGHLRNIMDDVLLLARMQARRFDFNPATLDPDALCRSILDEFQNRADIKHELRYQCQGADREILLDAKLMRQIMSNLISNAIKYSPATKPVQATLAFINDTLTFTVRDEGIGIPEADLKHLFEPFHRGTNVGNVSGTGLGLVITKESVELHGGMMTVESQLEQGTTFTVTIPVARP